MKKAIVIDFFIILFIGIGMSLLVGVLPFYGESLKLSKFELGVIISLTFLSNFVAGPIWGELSDRYGCRKPFIIASLITGGFLVMLTSFCTNAISLGVIIFLGNLVIASVNSLLVPILTDIIEKSRTGAVIGMYVSGGGITSVIGLALSGLLIEIFGYTCVLTVAGLFLWLGGLTLLGFKEIKFKSKNVGKIVDLFSPFLNLIKPRTFLDKYCVCTIILGIADAVVFSLILLFLEQVIGVSKAIATFLLALGPLMRTFIALFLGNAINKYSVRKVLDIGMIGIPLAYLAVALSPNMVTAALSLACEGGVWGIYYFGSQFLFASVLERERKGAYMGLLNGSWCLGWLLGSLLEGGLLTKFSFRYTYLFGSLVALSGAIIYSLYVRSDINF